MLVTLHVWRVPRRSLPRRCGWRVDRRRLRATPGVRFGKLLGTGTGTGFGPTDADLTRWAALVVWADPAQAVGFDDTRWAGPGTGSPRAGPASTCSHWPVGAAGPE